MALLRPLPGDLADRQCILELKINHCNAEFDEEPADPLLSRGKGGIARTVVNKGAVDVSKFIDELDLIRKSLEKNWVPDLITRNKVEDYDALYTVLEETNATLWGLEDKIRALKAAPDYVNQDHSWYQLVMETAFEIVTQNDIRSGLIKKINALWGHNTQEKMYA